MKAKLPVALTACLWAGLASASVHEGRFVGKDGAELGYRLYENEQAKGAIVLVNGYSETYLMYDELARPLVDAGFRVYTYDHRGQGVSDRLIPAIDVGFVSSFQDYVDDLGTFLDTVVKPLEPSPLNLVAHSTGGLVAVHYAAAHPEAFKRMVLSAPYFELNSGIVPTWIVQALASLNCRLGWCARFAPSQGGFKPETSVFEDHHLTHDRARFELMKTFIWGNPALLIRGASNAFLRETIAAGEQVLALAPKIRGEILLLQAADDNFVRPGRQQAFCARTRCELVQVAGTYHELFFEAEPMRSDVLRRTLEFLQRN